MKTENILIIVLAAALIFVLFGNFSQYGNSGANSCSMMSGFSGNFGLSWIYSTIFMALLATAFILFIVWLTKQLQGGKK